MTTLVVGKERWVVNMIQSASDGYQFALKCVEAYPASGIAREAIFSLIRKPIATAMDYSSNTYSMINIVSGRGVLVNTNELRAPGLFIGPLSKLLEGC